MRVFDSTKEKPGCCLDLHPSGDLVIKFVPFTTTNLFKVRQIPGRWFDRPNMINRAPLTRKSFDKAASLFPEFAVSLRLQHAVSFLPSDDTPPPELIPTDGPQPPQIAVELFPYQRAGVEYLRTQNRAFICDQMRLGKTFQAIAWASFPIPGQPRRCILVICPAAAKYVWEEHISRARPQDLVHVVAKRDDLPMGRRANWIIINYDLLADRKMRDKETGKKYTIAGEAGTLKRYGVTHLIVDESHYCKSLKAARTRAVMELAGDIPRRILLTGTPIPNRVEELFAQLVILGKKQESDFFNFGRRYCDGGKVYIPGVGYRWDFSGSSNEEELSEYLRPFFVRRLRKEVWKDLPDTIETHETLPLDSATAKEYREAETDFVTWLEKHGKRSGSADHLRQHMALRQLAVRGKMKALVERLDQYRLEKEKVVIFSTFVKEGINVLESKLKPDEYVRITGSEDAEERRDAIARFQMDETCLFALCSIMATGVAVDLSAASTVMFLDEPWSPKVKEQAKDRIQHVDRVNKAYIITLIGKDTVDEQVMEVLAEKTTSIDKVVDGQVPALSEWEVAQAVEVKLRERGR